MLSRRELARLVLVLGAVAGLGIYFFIAHHFAAWDEASWQWLAAHLRVHRTLPDWFLRGFLGAVVAIAVGSIALNMAPTDEYGGARFAGVLDVMRWKTSRRGGVALCRWRGGLLGAIFGLLLLRSPALFAKELAVITLGPGGTGKTESMILPTLLSMDDSSGIVFDPKREIAEATAGHREKIGRVEVLNMAAGPERSACYNPLELSELPKNSASRGTLVEQFMAIVTTAVNGGEENFWAMGGAQLGTALALWHVYDAETAGKSTNFAEITRTVGTWDAAARSEGWMADGGPPPEDEGEEDERPDSVRKALIDMAERAERKGWPERVSTVLYKFAFEDARTRSGFIASLFTALGPWLNENIAGCTKSCSFSVKDFRAADKPLTVYMTATPFEREVYGRILALILRTAVQELTKRKPGPGEREVFFLLDEARFLPKTAVLQEGPAILRGFGVRVIVAVQDLAQLENVYGRLGRDELVNNMGWIVAFAQNDNTTAKLLEASIGNRTRRQKTSSATLTGGSTSTREEGYPLVPAQKIKSLKRKVLVLRQGTHQTPIVAPACYIKKVGWLRRRMNRPPSARVLRAIAATE